MQAIPKRTRPVVGGLVALAVTIICIQWIAVNYIPSSDLESVQAYMRKSQIVHPRRSLDADSLVLLEKLPKDYHIPTDIRHKDCKKRVYQYQSTTVTIIIPYLNESWDWAKKALQSMLHNTPPAMLDEILLIDDGNDPNDPRWNWKDKAMALHPKVRVHSNTHRQGLIRSKNLAIDEMRYNSTIVMFLEPHVIVQPEWLQPLVERVASGETTIAVPVLDVIPENDFTQYHPAQYHLGGFDWAFEFNWYSLISQRNKTWTNPEPFPTPVMPGGVFAILRSEFIRLGRFDPGMLEWGGEQIEMSLKAWMCGGSMEIVPCSRMGHVFRARNPYKVHIPQVIKNQKRCGEVWTPKYMSKFYAIKPDAKHMDVGDLRERIELRDSLKCRDMDWYIKNVYPELQSQPDFVTHDWLNEERQNGFKSGEPYRPVSRPPHVDLLAK